MSTDYELIHYPTDGTFANKTLRGTYPSTQDAMAAANHPDPAAWQESGTAWILADPVIEGLGREFSPYLIQPSRARTVNVPTADDDATITLRLIEHGERTITVDRAEYEAAKAADELDHYLDVWASNIDTDTVVVEPDGTEFNPYR